MHLLQYEVDHWSIVLPCDENDLTNDVSVVLIYPDVYKQSQRDYQLQVKYKNAKQVIQDW